MSPRKKKSNSHGHVAQKREIQKDRDDVTRVILQDTLLSPGYILQRVFRKDGPLLGSDFDSLPSNAFLNGRARCKKSRRSEKQRVPKKNKVSGSCGRVCNENQGAAKRRKVCRPAIVLDNQDSKKKSLPTRQHGMGKGLMTVWRVVNPDAGDVPTGLSFSKKKNTPVSTSVHQKPLATKKSRKEQPVARRLAKVNKVKDKLKPPISRRKMKGANSEKPKQPRREKCELVLIGERCQEDVELFALLVDDEELELQELQARRNPLSCCAHLTTNGLHGCSLCKGCLDKFPPNSIMMRPPLYEQPWGSSPELVKKLFKVFHFLCTYAEMLNICSFTLDEFALAFQDKDSMLLGKVHVALLKFLLSEVETEFVRGFVPRASQNGKFIELLHWVENQRSVVEFWMKSLNPLSWTEILRQVYVAAGFASGTNTPRKEGVNKEVNCMVKYGLKSGTLKGELFSILSEQGSSGKKVADLAKFPKIADLNLAATSEELELLISFTLSSDISLFEKISCSSFRLRINSVAKEAEMLDSDGDDCGSIDDESKDSDTCMSGNDSDCDLGISSINKRKQKKDKNGSNILTVFTEIDESHPGESWLLGLMDGEYSNLSIEEKLNAFLALVDLLGAGTISRSEDPINPTVDRVHNIHHYTSGGKIKRSSGRQFNPPTPFSGFNGQKQLCKSLGQNQPVDSAAAKLYTRAETNLTKYIKQIEDQDEVHPMQSVFLGSDRRYNRYWFFLGPCTGFDPGHKRIYFESSDDGRWEIIDTEEALCSLMSVLDYRGMREAHLLTSLRKREPYLCQAMSNRLNGSDIGQFTCSGQSEQNTSREDSSSAVSEVDNLVCATETEKDFQAPSTMVVPETGRRELLKQKWYRLQEFDMWIWNLFYFDLNSVKYGKRSYHESLARCECCHDLYWRDEKHCKTCHTTFELDFDLEEKYVLHFATCKNNGKTSTFPEHKVLPSHLQVLKAAAHAIESVMPEGALVDAWSKYGHKLWVKRLRRTTTLVEFLQVLGDFVAAINEEWLCQSNSGLDYNAVLEELCASFATMRQTISAVALWVTKLDAAISPHLKKVSVEK